ncbi:tRNA1(Val) (adenine(37)-N6)-methyltransferase [Salipaludibacillus neizhouensis]|nr:tRNA1(Val) (adenine(37)-N6)-methyltransferase [Salipaludibacillus neizhouensis]
MEENERLDYMPGGNRFIYQRKDVFAFSMDAVLLAKFVKVPVPQGKIMDLCAGNGAVPLMMTLRTEAKIDAVEIQELLCNLASKSMVHNGVSNQVRVIHSDILLLKEEVAWETYDVVTCNPPYFPVTSEKGKNKDKPFSLARHEVACTLEDVIHVSSRLVKQKGRVALVHRPERVADVFALMKQYRIEPKRIQYVHPKATKDANMVMVEGVREGNPGITTLPPWIVYDDVNQFTEVFKHHYEKD